MRTGTFLLIHNVNCCDVLLFLNCGQALEIMESYID